MKGPSGKDLGDYGGGTKDPHPLALCSLSPHSFCKKSPNLLAALLPPPDSGLKQCRRGIQPCAGMEVSRSNQT